MLISRFLQRHLVDLVNTNSFFDEVSKLHPLHWEPWEEKQETMGSCDSAVSSAPTCFHSALVVYRFQVSQPTAEPMWMSEYLDPYWFFALEFLIRYTSSVISTSWKACLWEKMLLIWVTDCKAWVQIVIALISYIYFPFVSICIYGNILNPHILLRFVTQEFHKVIECQA